MTPRAARRGSVRGLGVLAATTALLAVAPAASAHVTVDPAAAPAGQPVALTFTVPTEEVDQDTVGVDVSLPKGFLLEVAQSVPGWTTTVDRAADRTPIAVHWNGGHAGPGTFVTFSLRGRMPQQGADARFAAVQHYTRTTVSWSDPNPAAEAPAPVVRLLSGAPGAAPEPAAAASAAPVPSAPEVVAGADELARSRASLALALALGAFLLGGSCLGWLARGRRPGPGPVAVPPEAGD